MIKVREVVEKAKIFHMWINFKFLHMTDVEKSKISFILCTIYGILLHFTLFWWKIFFRWRSLPQNPASEMHVAPHTWLQMMYQKCPRWCPSRCSRHTSQYHIWMLHTATDWPKYFCIYRLECSKATIGWLDVWRVF